MANNGLAQYYADLNKQSNNDSRKNGLDQYYLQQDFAKYQNKLNSYNANPTVEQAKKLLNELGRYKGLFGEKSYNQLSDYLSSSIKQIPLNNFSNNYKSWVNEINNTNDMELVKKRTAELAKQLETIKNDISYEDYIALRDEFVNTQTRARKRSDAVDGINAAAKGKMATDSATSLDLLELLQLEQQGVKADKTVLSDMQKHLLGQETSNPLYTQMSSLEQLSLVPDEEKTHLQNELNGIVATEKAIAELEEENETLRLAAAKGDDDASEKIKENNEKIKLWKNAIKEAEAKYGTKSEIEAKLSNWKTKYDDVKSQKQALIESTYDISHLSYEERLAEYDKAVESGDELYADYIDKHKYDGLSYNKLLEIEEQLKEKATPKVPDGYDGYIVVGNSELSPAEKELDDFQRNVLYYAKHENELEKLGIHGEEYVKLIKENEDANFLDFDDRWDSKDKIREIEKEWISRGIMTQDEIDDLKHYIKGQYQKEKNESEMKELYSDVTEYNDLQELGITIGSSPVAFGGNVLTLFDSIYQAGRELFGGEKRPINAYSDINASAQWAKTVREAVQADQSDAGKFFYGVGCSLLDMYVAIAASGGIGDKLSKLATGKAVAGSLTKNVTLASMSLNAGGGAALDAMEKTSNPYEVAAIGVSSAVFEALAEKLPLDNLFKIAGQEGKITTSMILKAMGSQAVSEFGEEAATETANIIMEAIVLSDKSDWAQTVQDYIDKGYSESEARSKALVSMVGRVGMSGLAGAISGGFSGGGASTINYLAYNYSLNSTGKTLIKNNQVERLIELAETAGVDISAYNLEGKKGNYDAKAVGELYFEVMRNKSDAVTNALKEMGVSEDDVAVVQSAVLREAFGQNLSTEMQTKYNQYEDIIDNAMNDKTSSLNVAANDYMLTSLLVEIPRSKVSNASTDVSENDSAAVDFDTNMDAYIDTEVNVESSSDIDAITESEIAEADYLDNETLESVEENEYDKTIRLMDGRAKPLTEAQAYVQSVGRALGYTVVIDDLSRGGRTASGKSFKGTTRGFFDGQTIYLHEGQTTFDAVVEIFKHEITHYSELNPEMYEKYAKAVFGSKAFEKWISGKGGFDQYSQSIIDKYKKHGVSLETEKKTDSPTKVEREIIAYFTSEMLFNEKGNTLERFINEVNSEDRNAISRFIHDLISWLKTRLKGEKASFEITRLENRFAAVLRNVDNTNAQKNNTTNDGDVQYEYGRKKLDRKNKTVYNEFNTIAMQWANSSNVEQGEVKRLFDNNSKKWCLIIADENSDGGYYVLGTGTYEEVRAEYDRYIEEDANAFSEDIEAYKSFQGKYNSSMREHSEQRNGRQYSLGNRESGPKFAGTANAQYVRTNNQEKSSEAGLDNSAFSMPENDNGESYSFEITPEQDAEYQRYVESWNKESAQKMVDEKAKNMGAVLDENGNPLKLYRGTMGGQTVFAKETTLNGKIYTIDNIDVASKYGDKSGKATEIAHQIKGEKTTYALYGFPKKMLTIDAQYGVWNDLVIPNELLKYADGRYKATNGEIAEWAELEGYDSLRINNVRDGSFDVGNEIIFFDENLVKSADAITYDDNGDVIPLSERFNEDDNDIRYSFEDDVADEVSSLTEQYKNGEISYDEWKSRAASLIGDNNTNKADNPVSIANLSVEAANPTPDLPKRNRSNKKGDGDSKLAESIQKSDIFSKEFKDEVVDDDYIKHYDRATNKETMAKAKKLLDEGGSSFVLQWFNKSIDETSTVDVAAGIIMLDRYQKIGDMANALEVAYKLREMATISGQTVQIFSVLGRFTPEMMLVYTQHELDKAYETIIKGKTNKWIESNRSKFELTEAEKEFIIRNTLVAATLPEGRDKRIKLAEIATLVQKKIPHKPGDAYKALQRICMLLNPKTNVRNIVGNAIMTPICWIDDLWGACIDKLASKKSGVRTTGNFQFGKETAKAFAQGVYESYDDFIRDINTREINLENSSLGSGNNFNENHTGKVSKYVNPISKSLNALDRITSFILDAGDRGFFQMWFINSLNNQLRLNNATEPTAEMIEIATNDALERTWQDSDNMIVQAFSGMRGALNHLNIHGVGLGDLFIKFIKTTSNLLRASIKYSPAGFVKATSDYVKFNRSLKNGQFDAKLQRKFVNNLSKSITGTLLYVVFGFLAHAGVISGGADDDKDVAAFEKNILGVQPYSVKIGDYSFSYEWAQPIASGMAFMADLMNIWESDSRTEAEADLENALLHGSQTILNLSVFQSFQNIFKEEDLISTIINGIVNEVVVFSPQALSQVASVTDDYSRETYEKDNKIQTVINSVKKKIPGLRNTLPESVDVYGEAVENPYDNVWDAFFNPANQLQSNSSPSAEKIYELYQNTKEKSVIPPKAVNKITINGEDITFTSEERTAFQKYRGQLNAKYLDDFTSSSLWEKSSDEEKISIIKDIYSFTNSLAKNHYSSEHKLSKKEQKILEYEDFGIMSPIEYFSITTTADKDGNSRVSKSEYAEAVNNTDMSQQQKDLLIGLNKAEGKSDYSKNNTKGFGVGDWYYKKNRQYVKITSAAELNQLRRNNVDTYVYTGNYTDVIDELWRAYRGY